MTTPKFSLSKVISGGQTGADIAGLLAATKHGLSTGGTAPAGFMTLNGPNMLLKELGLKAEGTYKTRTTANIMNSDGTVILAYDMNSPGSRLTLGTCKCLNKPVLIVDLSDMFKATQEGAGYNSFDGPSTTIASFIKEHQVSTLNVAGNRESTAAGSFTILVEAILDLAFTMLNLEELLLKSKVL